MEYQSYKILVDFDEALVNIGFDTLSMDPSSEELVPFYELYNDSFREMIVSALSADLQKVFPVSVSLIRDRAYFNDRDARGLTYVKLRFSLTDNDRSFELIVERSVFHHSIILWFDDPEILRAPFSKQTLQVLRRFSNVSGHIYSAELARLGLPLKKGWFSVFWSGLFRLD